jgi:hypothetical protein
MSISFADFGALKWSLGALLTSTALAAGLYTSSETYEDQAQKEQQAAQRGLVEARDQITRTRVDMESMAVYQLEYRALETQKVIGNEQRLDWIEGLEKIRRQGLVPDFKYVIAPQQIFTPNPPLESGNFILKISPMTLQIDLLHEEQLLHLVLALQTQMPGWFTLDRCSLSRADAQSAATSSLKAECAGGWLTMKNRNEP